MLKKKTYENEEVVYFEYPPPRPEHGDAPNKVQPPFKNAPSEKCSVYYYWYEFLKLNWRYREHCETRAHPELASLFRDFGNVHELDFIPWWSERGRELFAEPNEGRVILQPSERLRNQGYLFLAVPEEKDLTQAMFEVKAVLTSRLMNNERPVFESQARYPVYARPNLPALHKCLATAMVLAEHGLLEGDDLRELQFNEYAALTAVKMVELQAGRGKPITIPPNSFHNLRHNALNFVKNTEYGLFAKDTAMGDENEVQTNKITRWQARRN